MLSEEQLKILASTRRTDFINADPFPHVVVDNFMPPDVLRTVVETYSDSDNPMWQKFVHEHSVKLACTKYEVMPKPVQEVLTFFNSASFVSFLEELTGIDGLMADPEFVGGGMHQISAGGFLKMHADFNVHPNNPKWLRQLNLLLYLNEDWDEDWGGQLELWDREMKECRKSVAPLFNRMVLFNTTSTSYHGHPDPLRCPPERSRRSLALYYYSELEAPADVADRHSTLYQQRPGEQTMRNRLKSVKNRVARRLRSLR